MAMQTPLLNSRVHQLFIIVMALWNNEQSTHVRIGDHEGLRTADWIQNGQRFIIVGEESEAVMQSLYELASELWI